ncbi:Tfp pilus assembly protein PilE [Elusimicrobium simillimum]|uniref:type IV pilin protein n=1 Tax=Elusimicrobium simillimum TaxID=3143438 RepID=UPI003C6F2D46
MVVVLIIGILAAVALPQYTKTVKKAKGIEALTMAKAVSDSASRYYLANGSYNDFVVSTYYSTGMDALDIEIPWNDKSFWQLYTDGTMGNTTGSNKRLIYVTPSETIPGKQFATLVYSHEGGKVIESYCPSYEKECKAFFPNLPHK